MKKEDIGAKENFKAETIEQRIRKALEENSDIIVVGTKERNSLTDMKTYIPGIHSANWILNKSVVIVEIHVAPKGGIYTVEELNKFMDGLLFLIPDIEPKFVQKFSQDGDTMDFGNLTFEEKIAEEEQTVKRIITLIDKTLSETKGFQNDRKIINASGKRDLMRGIQINVYPDEDIATQSIRAESSSAMKYQIAVGELEKHL